MHLSGTTVMFVMSLVWLPGETAVSDACGCERSFRPVCGTDGRTYNNECRLTCAGRGAPVELAYKGTCCPYPYCHPVDEPICDDMGHTHENECMFRYNDCVLRKMAGRALRIVMRKSCPTESTNTSGSCTTSCNTDDSSMGPVCDREGNSFATLCDFHVADCAVRNAGGHALVLAYKAECLTPMSTAPTTAAPFTSTEWSPDVGFIDQSTMALALLAATKAPPPPPLQFRTTAAPKPQPSTSQNTVAVSSGLIQLQPEEPKHNHVRGPHSETSTQEALVTEDWLETTAYTGIGHNKPQGTTRVEMNTVVHTVHTQNEPLHTTTRHDLTDLSGIIPAHERPKLCSAAGCTKDSAAVCGSDGRTYLNQCVFAFNACRTAMTDGRRIVMVAIGACDAPDQHSTDAGPQLAETTQAPRQNDPQISDPASLAETEPDTTTSSSGAEHCGGTCDDEYAPVCDTTGRTHVNLCAFARLRCVLAATGQAPDAGLPDLAYTGICEADLVPVPDPMTTAEIHSASVEDMYVPADGMSKRANDTEGGFTADMDPLVQPETTPSLFECPQPVCPDAVEPVCDSDGNSHDNLCQFAWQRCVASAAGRTLTIAYDGSCLPADCASLDQCDPNEPYEPLCGSDLRTYKNRCHFLMQQCRSRDAGRGDVLEVHFSGECSECLRTDCMRAEDEMNDDQLVCDMMHMTKSRCEFDMADCVYRRKFNRTLSYLHMGACCPRVEDCLVEYAPVCDVHNDTHDNECIFNAAKCNAFRATGAMLEIMHLGECSAPEYSDVPPSAPPPPPPPPPPHAPTRVSAAGGCKAGCTNEYEPVCGSDHRSYANLCHLRASAECEDRHLSVLHDGMCCERQCTRTWEPLCDIEGNTHQSMCDFAVARCERLRDTGAGLEVAHMGECLVPDTGLLGLCADMRCAAVYEPVCGTDKRTYSSECELSRVSCLLRDRGAHLRVDYTGACCDDTQCSALYAPVCDSDGTTHLNDCAFRRAACFAAVFNRTIQLVHRGACCDRPCTKQYDPVCDGRHSHPNMCTFKVAQCNAEMKGDILAIEYPGECCPVKECQLRQPVCDHDGNTHESMCDFEVSRCLNERMKNPPIKVAYEGVCCHQKTCPHDAPAVCDTEGVTHSSQCDFEHMLCINAATGNQSEVSVAYTGSCCSRVCDASTSNGTLSEADTVCDQNGRMYGNQCHFQIAQCEYHRKSGGILLRAPCPPRRQFTHRRRSLLGFA